MKKLKDNSQNKFKKLIFNLENKTFSKQLKEVGN